ncbi:hypothetical protein ACWERF_13190 [Streptomyces griseoluteus]
MTRLARRLYVPSVVTVVLGAVTATFGVLHDWEDAFSLGLVASVAALPGLLYCLTNRAAEASDDQLADAHHAGYRLALQHVSMGLLDSPAAPPDGGEGVEEEDTQGISLVDLANHLPDNVRPFRSRNDEEDDHRKAI